MPVSFAIICRLQLGSLKPQKTVRHLVLVLSHPVSSAILRMPYGDFETQDAKFRARRDRMLGRDVEFPSVPTARRSSIGVEAPTGRVAGASSRPCALKTPLTSPVMRRVFAGHSSFVLRKP
jgi:hypothetical protein